MMKEALRQSLATAAARRGELLRVMDELATQEHDCSRCSGVCCTFVANSMLITPLEALDIAAHLLAAGADIQALLQRLGESAAAQGLDRPLPGDGRRTFGRRRYTCPFFGHGALGCSLPRDAKPYGCLAFNPRRAGQTDGGDCGSPGVETRAGELELTRSLGLGDESAPIPVAVARALGALLDA